MSKYNKSPYRIIPEELKNDYTMSGKIPVLDQYMDNRKVNEVKWTNNTINYYIKRFTPYNIKNNLEGKSSYNHEDRINLLKAFEDFNIRNKKVAVIGSETPWIEAILINLKNKVTTIEYNVPHAKFNNLECKDYFEYFENNKNTFDAIVTFSSIEHSGLGRYGDPLDPNGDVKTMDSIYTNLKNDGLVIWGAPVGKDALVWNAHRIYGKIRLPVIFKHFDDVKWYGKNKEELFDNPLGKIFQPVIVLQPKS